MMMKRGGWNKTAPLNYLGHSFPLFGGIGQTGFLCNKGRHLGWPGGLETVKQRQEQF